MIDPTLFDPAAISAETSSFNAELRRTLAADPVPFPPASAAGYRTAMRELLARHSGGQIYQSPRARTVQLGETLSVRVIAADDPQGLYLHIHGGGWVLGSADQQDAALERIVETTGYTVASVEYRLAPEAPFPAALDDCERAARWLATSAGELGSDRLAIGGESAGANLALGTLVRLMRTPAGLPYAAGNLVYGHFDLTMTPSQRQVDSVIVTREMLAWFCDQYAPGRERRSDPEVSPLYADLHGLPMLLLTVGTADPVLDDSLFLYVRLLAANVTVELHLIPGADHSFDTAPLAIAGEAHARVADFLRAAPGGAAGAR